ncbi:MAG: glutamate-ammonia-ligase adenylyltransferase, partial [Myxococcota bacterium]
MTAPPGEPDTHRFAIETLKRRSRSLARAVARDPRVLDEIAEGSFATAHKPAEAYVQEALVLDPDDAYGELRRWRRRELIRIVLRDTATGDTSQTLRELSYLADAAIEAAGRYAVVGMAHRHGPPPCDWVVMALGNLGSSELNLSGDVDLIYVYESDEPPDAHRWFRRFFERLSRLLGDQTPDGFVYRIDLSLRPEGATGALCNSLDACERYYEAWGHPWERVAWLRARPVAGSASLGARVSAAMLPFVYRRSLDHRTLDELSVMKAEIDATAAESERDLKRGEGGIGAVEFFVHALQLVHGGRIPALRTRGTPDTLKRLALSGLVGEAERRALADAYLFFRAVENQLQLVEEEQTHTLPPDLEFVATALGTDAAALEGSLKRHREAVKTVWSRLFSGANALPRRERPWTAKEAEHLEALGRNPRSPWHESNRTRDADVARQLELALAEAADPEQALALLRDLVSALPGRGGFWPFLKAHPRRLRALVHLLGTSRFLGSLVARDPSLLEHVVLGAGGAARRSVQAVREALSELPEGAEAALKALRHRHDAELLRIGFFDVAGELSLEEVARELTGLADETIAAVLDVVRTEVDPEGTAGCVAVVAFGRLGAREMSWGSPVDLVFVYEGDMLRCSRLAQRVISGLSEHMTTGRLYEVDSRRRLDGPHRLAQTEGPELITP